LSIARDIKFFEGKYNIFNKTSLKVFSKIERESHHVLIKLWQILQQSNESSDNVMYGASPV